MARAHGRAAVLVERRQLRAVEPDAPARSAHPARRAAPAASTCRRRRRRRWRRFPRLRSCRSTSARMVSVPSGLLTCLVMLSALRTGSAMLMSRSGWQHGWRSCRAQLDRTGARRCRFTRMRVGTASRSILVVGDSLSAGYGVAVDATWVALLQQRLAAQGYGYRVVNASVSGETTGGARARLPRALELHKPAVVILELGGNDGLRGLPLRAGARELRVHDRAVRRPPAPRWCWSACACRRTTAPAYADSFMRCMASWRSQYAAPLVGLLSRGRRAGREADAGRRHPSERRRRSRDARQSVAGAAKRC